jgi:hypothetical protein
MSYKITKKKLKKIKKLKKSNINKIIKKTKLKGGDIGNANAKKKEDKCPHKNLDGTDKIALCKDYFRHLNQQQQSFKKEQNKIINPNNINLRIPRPIPSNNKLSNLYF